MLADNDGTTVAEGAMKHAKMTIAFAGLVLSFFALCSHKVAAQGLFGTISGVVTDSIGAVVPGATVKVTNIDTNVTAALKTNGAGVYVASTLAVGTYRVEAEALGFRKSVADRIVVQVGASPKVDLALAVGQATEAVNVNAANAAVLQTQQ